MVESVKEEFHGETLSLMNSIALASAPVESRLARELGNYATALAGR